MHAADDNTSAKKNGVPSSAVSTGTGTGARRRSSRSAGEGEGEGEGDEEDDVDAVDMTSQDAVERLAFDNLDSAVCKIVCSFYLCNCILVPHSLCPCNFSCLSVSQSFSLTHTHLLSLSLSLFLFLFVTFLCLILYDIIKVFVCLLIQTQQSSLNTVV